MDETERLLKELSEARATCGHEAEAREIMKRRLAPLGSLRFDALGSVICEQRGTSDRPRVMLAAHMDEIGFLVRDITPRGFLPVYRLGGWMTPVLPGQRMVVQTRRGDVLAVVGARPPHGVPEAERTQGPTFDKLYLDIGATSREEVAEAGIRVGDPVVPVAEFRVMHAPGTYVGKAFDDRVGCALLVDVLAHFSTRPHPNTLLGVATVQEETPTERGASVGAYLAEPDAAVILECAAVHDTPEHDPPGPVRLGGGPSLIVGDDGLIPNPRLRDLVTDVAERAGLPLQSHVLNYGANTDAKTIQLNRGGVPSIGCEVPLRYAHCHSGIIRRSDYDRTRELVIRLVEALDAKTVARLLAW